MKKFLLVLLGAALFAAPVCVAVKFYNENRQWRASVTSLATVDAERTVELRRLHASLAAQDGVITRLTANLGTAEQGRQRAITSARTYADSVRLLRGNGIEAGGSGEEWLFAAVDGLIARNDSLVLWSDSVKQACDCLVQGMQVKIDSLAKSDSLKGAQAIDLRRFWAKTQVDSASAVSAARRINYGTHAVHDVKVGTIGSAVGLLLGLLLGK